MAKCRFYIESTKTVPAPGEAGRDFKRGGVRGRLVYCAHAYSPVRKGAAERSRMSWLLLPCGGIVERCTIPDRER